MQGEGRGVLEQSAGSGSAGLQLSRSMGGRRAPITHCFYVFALLLLTGGTALGAETLRFAIIGDSGTGGRGQKAVAHQMELAQRAQPWDFVLMLGDNIYESGEPSKFVSNFKAIYSRIDVPFHATLGNHDRRHRKGRDQVEDDDFGYVGKQDEYVLEAGPVVGGKRLARFICLNSGAWRSKEELEVRSERLDYWLADSPKYHWNFVYFHHPLYSFAAGGWLTGPFRGWGHGADEKLRGLWESKFQKAGVDAVFSGHDHFYQKIAPQGGIHYFVSGGGGKVRKGARKNHPLVEFAQEILHFVQFELDVYRLRYQAIDSEGNVFHSGVIEK